MITLIIFIKGFVLEVQSLEDLSKDEFLSADKIFLQIKRIILERDFFRVIF